MDSDGSSEASPAGRGVRGVLAPVAELDRWLHVVLVALVVVSAVRYVMRHQLDATGIFILVGAVGFVAMYAARPRLPAVPWVVVVVTLWAALTLVAPSFAWTAVPVAFAVLRVIPFAYAAVLVVVMTLVVSGAWLRITDGLDPTLVAGPAGIALVTVIAFRALEREAASRQELLDDLTAAQADLAVAQRHSGALAERTRLSREIHDSVGQGLSSINLLLNAAEQDWAQRPDSARAHVRTAAVTARDGLDEVRRVVRDLAPAGLEESSAQALPVAVRRAVAQAAHDLTSEVRVHGDPVPVPPAVASAVVRSVRGALANVVEHSAATRVVVSLTYNADEVLLDVRDDGVGFEPDHVQTGGERGRGLTGIRDRAAGLGGSASVESAPGEGTTVSLALPLAAGEDEA
ncbi:MULTISPECIES: sensor histidine kinase [unclassified Knoellia]|uniref:sensor histidine kinase n=1 Tax=Knoellia altitudinis TaxID=3404795 RepID=UPI0036093A41